MNQKIDGILYRKMLMNAAAMVDARKQALNDLNVFPVPDGDTGTNMSMTIGNAINELKRMPDSVTVSEVASAAAAALLRGARGNSGVILSLLFRGLSKGLAGKESASCTDFANALELGVEAAYKAVMKPVEGTILTVAKAASVKAQEISLSTNDDDVFWTEVCAEADRVLQQTPDMLPVLKKAGVVDAGGQGFLIIIQAMHEVFRGGKIAEPLTAESTAEITVDSFKNAVSEFDEEINFTYCTEFIVEKHSDCPDPFKLRAYLETIGDCVVVVDDETIIKVHVHTDNPGKALQKALEFGVFINDPKPKIENMRIQHENKVKEAKAGEEGFVPAEPEKQFGFVAVAAGHGIEAMFTDLGADVVVRGGQTMNPATEDILRAILSTPAHTVFVLPNNKNIIMAAEQAMKLTDRNVCVLQTRTIPQGISAMLAFDETLGLAENRIAMTKAFERVQTGQITFAARDSEYEGHSIKEGEILALENGKLAFTERDINKAAMKLVKKLAKGDVSYLTLIYGSDVTEESAENMQQLIQAKLGDKIEVMLVNGGQPVYYYIISAE